MKSFLPFALFLAGALAPSSFLPAQTPPAAPPPAHAPGPSIQFNTENYDFGKILAGDTVKYTFVATNTGDDTLDVTGAKASCACTVVGDDSSKKDWTPQKVAPGQTCRIHVEIVTERHSAQSIAKFVTVTSNDKARPTVNLQVHGRVWLPIEVNPGTALFNVLAGAPTPATQSLRILNLMETPLTLSDPRSNTNAFSAVLKTNVPGQVFELTITAAPLPQLAGSFAPAIVQGEISLKSSSTNMNPLKVPILETLYPQITVYPANLQMPPEPLPQAMTNHITIRGNSADLVLSGAAANFPGVELSLNVVRTNRQYYLSVVFPAGFDIRANPNAALSVSTADPAFPLLRIPVSPMQVFIRPAPVLPPKRTSVLPSSIVTGVPTNSL